ncbi:serine/threonine-protein kinase Smg1 [Condylostylus longicornis]|uniref:serine/threonine-protein kinase Smg1 n=1 Tax=Condylostylus longicornis TaxID=2530218 RepID=UPI00244DABB8|nr:serine/threonine-protein kinase Smg1 [Condylostylus longicornis]
MNTTDNDSEDLHIETKDENVNIGAGDGVNSQAKSISIEQALSGVCPYLSAEYGERYQPRAGSSRSQYQYKEKRSDFIRRQYFDNSNLDTKRKNDRDRGSNKSLSSKNCDYEDEKRNAASTSATNQRYREKDLNKGQIDSGNKLNYGGGKKSDVSSNYNVSEEIKISKILRNLVGENHPSVAKELCRKLDIAITDQANSVYIKRAFDFIAESIISVFRNGPAECLDHLAIIFGNLGFIAISDFPIYKCWICQSYDTYKEIRVYLMKALKETFRLDYKRRKLNVYSERMLLQLKDYLENSDIVETFVAVSDCIAEFSNNYKKPFEKHFQDIVDIVVGWHLEMDQAMDLKLHCSNVLQNFSDFFVKKLDFTLGLLEQFLEDIAIFAEDMENEKSSVSEERPQHPPEISVGSFIGAFNTIIKCLVNDKTILAFNMSKHKPFFNKAVETITKVAKLSLLKTICPETVQSVNEFFVLILASDSDLVICDTNQVIEIICIQEKNLKLFSDNQICSFLFLVLYLIKNLQQNLPIELVDHLLQSDTELNSLKFSKNKKIFKLFIKIYHEILIIKNVPILQQAYKYILTDIREAVSVIFNKNNDDELINFNQSECILNFHLCSLSILATQTSSIIAMYALQPSILELFLKDLEADNLSLWVVCPNLHKSILNLLKTHCSKNHNFLLSSNLINGQNSMFSKLSLDDLSPTSENFTEILRFLKNIIKNFEDTNNFDSESFANLLNWLISIYSECADHADSMKGNSDFIEIAINLCKTSTKKTSNRYILIECAKTFKYLIKFHPKISDKVLLAIAEICCIHIMSADHKIRSVYTELLSKVPLNMALLTNRRSKKNMLKQFNDRQNDLKLWYNSNLTGINYHDKYFKDFIEKIANSNEIIFIDRFLKDIFSKCWVANGRDDSIEFYNNSVFNINMLMHWVQWESSQYCVNNKLRTALGKPQDTFLKIEALIKEDARIIANRESEKVNEFSVLVTNLRHAKILLGFLESLEKTIYNASNGTAFAISFPEKPARTFFRVNISTCNEWFNRIRAAVSVVALHCSEHEIVIRFSELVLNNMINSNKIHDPVFDHILMSLVWALLKCGPSESETLAGLYVWVKQKTGKRYTWIKYASDHAIGHLEKAADGYMSILKSTAEPGNIEKRLKTFVYNQLMDCLYFTNQWGSLVEMFETSAASEVYDEFPNNMLNLNIKQITQMKNFEENFNISLIDLSDWDHIKDFENLNNNFSSYKLITRTENTLVSFLLNCDKNTSDENKTILENCINCIQSCLEDCIRTGSNEHFHHLIILNHVTKRIIELNSGNPYCFNDIYLSKQHNSRTMIKIKRWMDLIHAKLKGFKLPNYENLCLDLISSARKETNLKLCKTELEKFLKYQNLGRQINVDLYGLARTVNNNSGLLAYCNEDETKALFETSKWLFSQNDYQVDGIKLASSVCLKIIESFNKNASSSEKCARMLLNLSDWLPQCADQVLAHSKTEENFPFINLMQKLPEIKSYSDEANVIPLVDMMIGKLIQMSVKEYSNLAKSWLALGGWYYRWGKKIVEAKTITNAGLSPIDIETMQDILSFTETDVIQDIISVLNQHQVVSIDDEEIGSAEQTSTDIIEQQLRLIPALHETCSETITSIILIWKRANKSVYSYYEMAADAYFKFLNLATENDENSDSDDTDESYGDCAMVTATLRLLRLVVKHALGLQDVLEEGLSSTPTKPWKAIIPQLFSRLNHHELYVRKRVSELLCRVAKDSPHLIIFPAVVGATQRQKGRNLPEIKLTEKHSVNEKYNEHVEEVINPLTVCFNSLLSTLSKQAPETVEQVQILEKELKRISLLWDEFWLHALAQLYSEYSELFNSFEAEVKKCSSEEKYPLLYEKHKILTTHIVDDLERFYSCTSQPPETNYEAHFQEKYLKIIRSTIENLKQKTLNLQKPNESWQKIKQLYSVFQQKFHRNFQNSLKMSDISPILADLKNTVISMPGVETGREDPIYIKSVDNAVNILPTKTRPKKLAFYGSNGKKYTYLFKGLEDLHLDERIMQFLSISNSMMAKSNNDTLYRAHHYSVIPLGPQSGLISWVDGMTPLFSLYKKWQQREASNPMPIIKRTAVDSKSGTSQQTQSKQMQQQPQQQPTNIVMRPSELFYKKLTPLLAEQNLKPTDSRKTWPLSVLRKVLEDLTRETPRDLLAKELWCCSSNAADWRKSIKNYSRSIAVMSVIGYVIGLGDRHLDNVLVHLSTGNIVHIDYNVCFEKGKTLRVPERIPFRMTQNLEEALGITGIEGIFRLTCEHVLKTLRKEREILLTLLEAFVYDPLVDWAVSDDCANIGGVGIPGGDVENPTNAVTTTSNFARTTKALIAAVDIAALDTSSTAKSSSTTSTTIASTNNNPNNTEMNQEKSEFHDSDMEKNKENEKTTGSTDISSNNNAGLDGGGDNAVSAVGININNVNNGNIADRRPSRKKLENEVMRNTLITRFAEIKPAWTQYRNDLTEQLQDIYKTIIDLEMKRQEIIESEKHRNLRGKQHAMVQEISALGTAMSSHPLNTISLRYEHYKRAQNDFEIVKKILETKYEENTDKKIGYLKTISLNMQEGIHNDRKKFENILPFENEFSCLKDFLANSAQTQLYNQADQVRNEMCTSVEKQMIYSKVGLDTLEQYINIVQFYPRSILLKNRLFWYQDVTKLLLEHSDEHQLIKDRFESYIRQEMEIPDNVQNIVQYASELERIWLETNINLTKTYELLNSENPVTIKSNIHDSLVSIQAFMQSESSESVDKLSKSGLLCAIMEIINNFIQIEESASIDPTNQLRYITNSNWILDEYTIFLNQMIESLTLFNKKNIIEILAEFNCLIQSLRKLLNVFNSDIIPNIVKFLMSEDDAVLKGFDSIVCLQNFHQIDALFEKIRQNINCENDIRGLNERYRYIQKEMVGNSKVSETINLTENVLNECYNNLIKLTERIDNFEDDPKFVKFDHWRRSKTMMSKHLCGSHIIKQFFEIKKIRILIELILIGRRLSNSIKQSDVQCVYDINIFVQIVMNLISDILTHFVIGLGSRICTQIEIELLKDLYTHEFQLVEEQQLYQPQKFEGLLNLSVEHNISTGLFTLPLYGHIQILWKNLLISVKKLNMIENLKLTIVNRTDSLKHMQIISSVHYWINEKILSAQLALGHVINRNIIHRNLIIQSIQQTMQHIRAWQISIEKINSELTEFTTAINQRLKWAVGANPNLQNIRQEFEELSIRNDNKIKTCLLINTSIIHDFNCILAYEMFKSNNQSLDQEFLLLVEQVRQTWRAKVTADSQISLVEKGIVELLNPEGNIDYQWINNITGLLDDIIDDNHNNIVKCEKDIQTIQENLQALGQKLRSLLDSELRIDVRYLLKLVFKIEGGHQAQRQKQFQSNYKQLLGKISDLHVKILSKDFTEGNCHEIKEIIGDTQRELNELYEELLKLVADGNDGSNKDSSYQWDGTKQFNTPTRERKKGNQLEQKRNAYGVSVWRRIRMKLEGRDPDPNRRQTIAEQVDWMIREARNPDNLAVLYEGWTPWV